MGRRDREALSGSTASPTNGHRGASAGGGGTGRFYLRANENRRGRPRAAARDPNRHRPCGGEFHLRDPENRSRGATLPVRGQNDALQSARGSDRSSDTPATSNPLVRSGGSPDGTGEGRRRCFFLALLQGSSRRTLPFRDYPS